MGISLAQWWCERGREHQITEIVEAYEENAVDGHAPTKLT
jgi:hypothetical protein